jgi:uncharacterized membrane protein
VTAKARLPAIDVMRGLVMVLMTVDHASEEFNGGRLFTDGVFVWTPGTALPAGQFFLRWITHLCAPTFVLLAGAALALSTEARARRGDAPGTIDRHIVLRGGLLVLLEVAWMSPVMVGPGSVLLQVLYAIGASLACMAALRRLSDRALLATGLALAILAEPLAGLLIATHLSATVPAALLVTGGFFADGRFIVAYPLLPWLAIMCAGWVLGRRLLAWPEGDRNRAAARVLAVWGVALLATFVVVRGVNSYGNMALLRDDASLVQWLHVSKYPPSVAFDGLELGLACVLLAGLFAAGDGVARFAGPVRTLGQVALFYYLLHIHLLALAAVLGGVRGQLGIGTTLVAAAGALALLYPLVAAYGRYKAAHPGGWRQYI